MILRCPSAQPDMEDAQVLGVVRHSNSERRVSYLNGLAPVTQQLLDAVAPAQTGEVLRIAARCEASRCGHFDGQTCTLGARVAALLPEVVDRLPPCTIRRSCRWYSEQGAPVCLRCPQIVTQVDRNAVDPQLAEIVIAK